MTVLDPPVRRRPRRANSLKDIGRLLSGAGTAHEVSRKARFEAHAAKLFKTDRNNRENYFSAALANLFLLRYGVQLIANDRVMHFYEEWPGMDRRCVSGSVLNPAISPKSSNVLFPPRIAKRASGSTAKGFQPGERPTSGWSVFLKGGGIGAAWLDDGPAGDVLRHLKSLALDGGAPVPRPAQADRLDVSRWTGLHGGPTSHELRLATLSKEKLNERIVAHRDGDPVAVADCEAYEKRMHDLDELIPGHRQTAWERMVGVWAQQRTTKADSIEFKM